MQHRNYFLRKIGFLTLTSGLLITVPPSVQAATFIPPSSNSAPRQTTGGASRSAFIPPSSNSAPRQTTGGASRGTFIPPSSNSAPGQTTGGASRGTFIPPSSNSAPGQTTGGASRATFTPPANNGAPKPTIGGSSRTNVYGTYLVNDQPLAMKALLPNSFFGTTVSERPAIMVYLPASNAREAIFTIKDEAKNLIYQTTVPISGIAGIVVIQMPETAPALAVNQNYQWFVALKLDGRLSPNSPFVDGWIKRIIPDAKLAHALVGKSALQQSSVLATNGVWYDSASILAKQKMARSADAEVTKEWTELLDSVELSDLTTAPIVPSVR